MCYMYLNYFHNICTFHDGWPMLFLYFSLCNWNFVLIICDIFITKRVDTSLSHTSLGWLYVFNSFPLSRLPPHPPHPPPQQLLPLTSKPFQLNLRYLAQNIYGSQEMYWMTFPWPWPKVTAVASISKNLLVCAIKWQPLIASLHNIAALLPLYIAMVNTWLDFGAVLLETFKKRQCIGWILGTICILDLWPHSWPWPWMFQGQISNSSISGIVGLIDVKWKWSELIWYWADCMTLPFDHTHDLDLGVEISRSESEIALS